MKCSIRIGLEDADAKLFKQTVIGDAEASLARGAVRFTDQTTTLCKECGGSS